MNAQSAHTARLRTYETAHVTRVLADELPRVTQQLDPVAAGSRLSTGSLRELVKALGDPHHPRHAGAVAGLVAIGLPAVPELAAALNPARPWLTAYRAADALGQIGDGGASGALIGALRHPNSNVRWNVVRALAEIGDRRSIWALRRVASQDRGKTSWGEPVADTALLALKRLEAHSALPRVAELIKTTLLAVVMFGTLLFAAAEVAAMRAELRREAPAPAWVSSVETTGSPEHYMALASCAMTPTAPARPLPGTAAPAPEVIGRVRVPVLNVRSAPWSGNNRIGLVHAGDVPTIVGGCEDWYRVQLAETQTATSKIKGGEGWIARVVVSAPRQAVPPAQAAPQP